MVEMLQEPLSVRVVYKAIPENAEGLVRPEAHHASLVEVVCRDHHQHALYFDKHVKRGQI